MKSFWILETHFVLHSPLRSVARVRPIFFGVGLDDRPVGHDLGIKHFLHFSVFIVFIYRFSSSIFTNKIRPFREGLSILSNDSSTVFDFNSR